MRLTLRKVVKFTTFLIFFLMLNVWVSYNVNFWSFNNFDDRGKVLRDPVARGRDGDNGGAVPVWTNDARNGHSFDLQWNDVKPQQSFSGFAVSRNQRSAKAFDGNRDYPENDRGTGFENRMPADNPHKGINLLRSKTVKAEAATTRRRFGTNSDSQTALSDIFISVKTTSKYHNSRIRLIQRTWYALAREEVSGKVKCTLELSSQHAVM